MDGESRALPLPRTQHAVCRRERPGRAVPDHRRRRAREPMTSALLVLADGRVFRGSACGAAGETNGEVVFNTAMTGYQEILTDPSYRGQIVCMTYPLIGNYGINPEDVESRQPWVNGFIVKEACGYPSNWRGRMRLDEYMQLLIEAFNPSTIEGLMCRNTISVGWRGEVYDCDFNQQLGMQWNSGQPIFLWDVNPDSLENREIMTGDHCFGCTAGAGSTCGGAIM